MADDGARSVFMKGGIIGWLILPKATLSGQDIQVLYERYATAALPCIGVQKILYETMDKKAGVDCREQSQRFYGKRFFSFMNSSILVTCMILNEDKLQCLMVWGVFTFFLFFFFSFLFCGRYKLERWWFWTVFLFYLYSHVSLAANLSVIYRDTRSTNKSMLECLVLFPFLQLVEIYFIPYFSF